MSCAILIFLTLAVYPFVLASDGFDHVSACQLSTTPCELGEARLNLESDFVKPLTPTKITLEMKNQVYDHFILSLNGVEMNMGTYKLRLESSGNHVYQGHLMLPLCMHDEMTWQGKIESEDRRIQIPVATLMKMQ